MLFERKLVMLEHISSTFFMGESGEQRVEQALPLKLVYHTGLPFYDGPAGSSVLDSRGGAASPDIYMTKVH